MQFNGHVLPRDAVGYFRVASGEGRYPVQIVTAGDFLIGRGSKCHMRLGNDSIPELHTVVASAPRSARVRCAAAKPPLLVNGVAVTDCRLHDGDLIEIGPYELLFRFCSSEQRITLDETIYDVDRMETPIPTDKESETADSLNADELVRRIEAELEILSELEHTPESGAAELLRAAGGASDVCDQEPHVVSFRSSSTDAPAEPAGTGDRTTFEILQLLRHQHESGRLQLESITSTLNHLVRQQQLIADALTSLAHQVEPEPDRNHPSKRASA